MTEQHNPAQIVPETVDEALAAWDRGDEVQTIEMGGLGDGYEMAIQCVAFEMLRELRDNPNLRARCINPPDGSKFDGDFTDDLGKVAARLDAKDSVTGKYSLGGLSGAQVGAATSMAVNLTRNGYQNARDKVPERMIFVRRQDPVALYEAENTD